MMKQSDIKSMTPEEITANLKTMGEPVFRGGQIHQWLQKGASDFDQMTDLSAALRHRLKEKFYISTIKMKKKLESDRSNTVKYLYEFSDGQCVETVLMDYRHGTSICISTQVGCKMGCAFCATGQRGFARDLTAAEMLLQIEAAQQDSGKQVKNVVLMGMGEPLDNLDQVLRFLQLTPIGQRHISVSTCGLVDKIDQLAELHPQFTLSVSLHAADDETRNKIVPVNKKWNIAALLASCKRYIQKTNRRISFEYALIDQLNDHEQDAEQLAKLLKGMLCHVNLIPVNPTDGNYQKSAKERIRRFQDILTQNGVNATVRRTLGDDINASCGQLAGEM